MTRPGQDMVGMVHRWTKSVNLGKKCKVFFLGARELMKCLSSGY